MKGFYRNYSSREKSSEQVVNFRKRGIALRIIMNDLWDDEEREYHDIFIVQVELICECEEHN